MNTYWIDFIEPTTQVLRGRTTRSSDIVLRFIMGQLGLTRSPIGQSPCREFQKALCTSTIFTNTPFQVPRRHADHQTFGPSSSLAPLTISLCKAFFSLCLWFLLQFFERCFKPPVEFESAGSKPWFRWRNCIHFFSLYSCLWNSWCFSIFGL